jgi:O-antigen/teichoic acid export membrane protein
LKLRLRELQFPQAAMLLSFGASMVAIFLLGKIVAASDSIIIASIFPIDAVTFFVIAGSLCQYAKDVVTALSNVMTPRVSALTSMGSDRVTEEVLAVAGIGILISTPIAVTFLIRGESFIALWMGSAYGPVSGEILKVFAVVVWLEAGRSLVINTLVGMGKHRTLLPGLAIEAGLKVALSYALAQPFGLPGVALGTLIPSALVTLGYLPHRLSMATQVSMSSYYYRALLLPTVACLPFALASALIERYAPATSLLLFFAEVLLILPLVPIAAWFSCLTIGEKALVRARFARWSGK